MFSKFVELHFVGSVSKLNMTIAFISLLFFFNFFLFFIRTLVFVNLHARKSFLVCIVFVFYFWC